MIKSFLIKRIGLITELNLLHVGLLRLNSNYSLIIGINNDGNVRSDDSFNVTFCRIKVEMLVTIMSNKHESKMYVWTFQHIYSMKAIIYPI